MADVTKDTKKLTDAEFDDLLSRADAAIAEIDRATAKGRAYADALAGKEIGEGRAQSAEFNRGVETETAKSAGRAASATRGFEAKQSADRAKRSMDVSAKSSKASVALTKANVKKNRAQTAADLAEIDYSNAEHDAYDKVTDDLRERKFALTKRKAAASKSGSGSGGTTSDVTTPENGSYNDNRGQITPPKSLADRDPLGLRDQNGQTVTDANGNKTWKQDETGLKNTANTKTSVSRIDDFADTVFRNMANTVDANGNYVYDLDYINENVKGSSIQRKCMNAYMTVQNTYTNILENGLSAAKRKDYIEAMKNVGVNEAYATGLVDDLGKYYAATLKKNMTAQAQLAKALGLEQSLDVRGYIATALDVGAYDTDFALGLIGQNDGDHIVSVSLYGMQKIGKGLPADLAVQKQNAGNGDYIEVEKKNINIDTATSDEIYAAAQRSVDDAEKAFLLGVLADRVINKGESDRHGILQEHAAALRENEEKKERAKNAKESREELEAYAKETYGEYAEQYIKFVENPQEAEAYIENFCSGDVGTFTERESKVGKFILDGISDNTGSFFHDFAGFDGRVTGDFIEDGKHSSTHKGNKNIEIALEAIRFVDPEKGFELYNKIASAAKQAYDIYEYAAKRYREEYARTDHFDNTYYFANDLAVHYRELYNICVNRKEQAWVSWKLSLLGNDGELAQGLVDIYTDGISYWDTGKITAAEAEKFDVEVLKDVLTRVYDKQGNDISRDTLDSVTQTEDGKPLSKFEQVKALLDFAMDKAAVYDESFAQKYAEAYIKRYLPGLSEETGGDVAYAIELLGDQIKAQKMQEAIREGMNTDNGFVNALLDLGGLVLSVGTNIFASIPAFLESTFSGGGDRPKNYYGTFGRTFLAGQQMRQEAIGDVSRHVFGAAGAKVFGEDARATTEEWSNAILSGAMSVVDSYIGGRIFGGLAKIASANFGVSATVAMNFAKQMTLFTMSSGAGYSTMVQMHEKGYSDREAVAYGWVSAFAEYISETINIDTVVSPEKLKGAKAHLWNMFEEGTEEVISNIVNDVYDLAIMQDSGEIAKEIEEYVSAGEDRGSAVRKVIGDHLYQSFQDFIGGAVGGGLGTAMGAAGEQHAKVQARTELGNAVRSRADLTEQAKGLSEEAGKKITSAEEKLEAKKEKIKQKADKKGKTVSTAKIDSKTKLQSKHLTRTVGKYVQQNLEYEEAKKTVSDYADKGEGISAKDITQNAELKSAVKKLAGKNPSAVKNPGVKGVFEKAAKKVIGETVTKKNAVAQFEKAKATEVSDVGKRAIKSVQNYLYDKENAAAVEYAKNVAKTFPNSFFAQKAQAVDIDYYTKEDASGLLSLTERVGEAYARVRKTDTETATPTSKLLTDLTFLSGTDVTAENFSEMLEKVKKQGAKTDSLETLADAVERSAELISELDEKDKRLIKRYRPDVREMLMEEEGDEDVIEGDGSHLIPLEKRIEAYEAFKSAAKAGIAEDVDLSRYEGRISQKLKAKAIADGAAEVARDGRKGTSYALLDRADFDRKMKSRNFAAQVRLINALARKWGVHVTFTDMLGNGVYAEASNGLFVGNNQIVIDVNSDYGMLTATFTHEGYHYLEKRNKTAAEEMKKLVFDMLGEEGAKKARKEMRARGYAEDVIDSEIVADSLFDVLSEKGIIKEMSKETRVSVADMLRHLSDSIREMLSRLTGTETWRKELRDKATNYRHLSNMFMNAMDTAADDVQRAELVEDIRGEKTEKEAVGEKRFSLKKDELGYYVFVDVDQYLFENKSIKEMQYIAKKVINERFRNKVLNVGDSGKAYVNKRSGEEFSHPASRRIGDDIKSAKMRTAPELDNLLKASTFLRNEQDDGRHPDAVGGWDIYSARFKIGADMFVGQVKIKVAARGYQFYDVTKIERLPAKSGLTETDSAAATGNLSTNSISHDKEKINPVSENSFDKKQSKKKIISETTEKQYLELAKDPEKNNVKLREMVDEAAKRAGYGIRAYHGTGEAFTEFAKAKIGANYEGYLEYGAGFYFTPSREEARKWAANGEKINGNNVMSVYLAAERMMNPDESISDDSAESILKKHGYFQNDIEFTLGRGYRFIEALIHFGYSNAEIQKQLKAMGYDGVDASYGKENKTGQYVIFDPEQVKSADLVTYDDEGNIIPLSERFRTDRTGGEEWKNEDIRYSARELDSDGSEYWQIESEKDIFRGMNETSALRKAAYNFILHGDKGKKILGLIDGKNLEFIRVSAREYVYGRQSQTLTEEAYKQKMRMSTSVIDLIDNATMQYDAPDHKNHKLFPNGFKNYQGRVGIDSTIFRYIVRVGKAKNGMIFYDINLEVDGKVPRANRASLIKTSTSDRSISQSVTTVNTNISEKSKNSTEKYSDRDYSYDNLVSKPDMKVTQIGTEAPSNRADIVFEAKRNASKIGKFNVKDGSVSVYVDDIGTDVVIGKKGLLHGLQRGKELSTKATVTVKIGEILKNSIKVNEATPKDSAADRTYVLIGCATDNINTYAVRSIINTFSSELQSVDVLYAVNTKKETAVSETPRGSTPSTVSTVSITDLLDYVNRCFPEVLSADVLQHFGHESRPEGKPKGLGESMLYSDRDITLSSRYLLANALESTARNEVERDWLGRYKADIEKYNAEQDKLTTLNAQIKELSFGKGKRDMAKLRQLRDEKIKTENRITIYDKRLLRIETAKPLQNVIEREKTKAKNKALQQGREALDAYKKTAAQKLREEVALRKEQRDIMRKDKRDALQKQRDEYRQKEETKRLRRNMTNYRDGIKKIREDFVQRLTRGSETNFVPETLANNIIDICNAIDPTGRVYYKPGTSEVDIERTRAEYEFDKGESRAVEKYDTAKAALLNLKNEYDKLQNDANYDLSSEYDEEFSSLISQLADNVGDTPLREMNLGQLENVYNILSDINFMMKTAARQIGTNENISNYEAGQEIIGLMKEIKSLGLTTNKAEDFFRTYTLNPMRAVKEMSAFDENSRLVKLFNALNEGRRKADTFRMNVNKKLEAIRDKDRKAYNDAVEKEYDFGLTDIDGNEVHISKMQAMFAVLTARREAANADRSHLQTPVLFPSLDLEQKGKYEDAKDNGAKIMLDGNAVAKIMDGLSEWDKEYLAVAEKVFNEDCKDAVNATTMQIKHRPVALEASYVPYIVNQDYIAKESDNIKFDKSILNEGILKDVKKNAQQQLIMQSLNSALDDHIGKVAKLYGLAVPIRNWNKVFNMRQTTADGGETVKTALRETWHKAGVELLDRAVADMQSSRMISGNDAISKALQATKSAFVVSTLASNISVSIKQAASYPTAGSVLSAAALTKGLADYYAKIKDGVHAQDVWDEIDEHTSQHWIRRQGLSTQELGELVQSKGILNKLNNKLGKASPMNWIQAIDVGTTAALWYACKVDVRRAGYAEGSREYWNKVTELYDKVIEETQPMYDSLHRAEITKDNELVKNIVMFQTQPIQNSGILRESAMELKMAKRRFGKNSEQVREANRKFVKAVASQAASHLTFTAMTLLAQMLLHRMNPWRDKDGEVSVKGVSVKFLEEFAKSYFGAIVPIFGNYGTSIIEAFVSKFNGKSSYDILSDATVDKINGTADKFLELTEPSWDNVTDALCEVATYFGIPAENIKKIIMGAKYHIEDIANGDFLKFKAGYNGSSSSSGQAEDYIDLIANSKVKDAKKMYDEWVSDKKEEIKANRESEGKIALSDAELDKKAKESVKNSVSAQFKKRYIEAYKKKDTSLMTSIRFQMRDTGLWKSVDDIIKACGDWIKEYKKP